MPCYQCNRCNKCGMLSTRVAVTCKACGEPVMPGRSDCPKCGASYAGHMRRGKMTRINSETGKPEEIIPLSNKEAMAAIERAHKSLHPELRD